MGIFTRMCDYTQLSVHQIELEIQNEELRRIQEELENSRDKYTHLFDFSPVGYFTVSEKGFITEANLKGAAMFGVERNNLIGMLFTRFVQRQDQDIFYQHRQHLLETKRHDSCDLRLVKKDGPEFYAHLESMIIIEPVTHISQVRVAEFERDLLIERTQAGIIRAKAAGKKFGRPPTLNTEERAAVFERLDAGVSIAEIARQFKTTRQTIIRVRAKRL